MGLWGSKHSPNVEREKLERQLHDSYINKICEKIIKIDKRQLLDYVPILDTNEFKNDELYGSYAYEIHHKILNQITNDLNTKTYEVDYQGKIKLKNFDCALEYKAADGKNCSCLFIRYSIDSLEKKI
jgi:hypothetical protein